VSESVRSPGGKRGDAVATNASLRRRRILAAAIAAVGIAAAACASGPSGPSGPPGPSGGHAGANPPVGTTGDCDSVTTCYTPHQIQIAYGIESLLKRGIDGRDETVVLPELAESAPQPPLVTDLRVDMAAFDRRFGLPAARLRVVTKLAGASSPWLAFGEEVLDAEMVHVVAPAATIVILLVPSDSLASAASGVAASVASLRLGVTEGAVISISAAGQTGGEHCDTRAEVASLNSALQDAVDHRVTVLAASGDVGAAGEPCQLMKGLTGGQFPPVREVNLPASDPLVLSVGGTTLNASHQTGAYIGERGWGLPYGDANTQFQGSGGGFSRTFARPAYQDGVRGIGRFRGVPDVSSDAAGHTGMALVIGAPGGGFMIRNSGGTSATAPFWAGVIALADQYARRPLGFVNPAIYRIAASPAYHQAFHDVVAGGNEPTFTGKRIGGYSAGRGWDPVTGWGSPVVSVLVPLLARYGTG